MDKLQLEAEIVKFRDDIQENYKILSKRSAFFEEFEDKDGEFRLRPKDPLHLGYKEDCPAYLPNAYTENPTRQKKVKKPRQKPEERYPLLYQEALAGHITNNTLKISMGILHDQTHVLIKNENGVITAFEENRKGTSRYAVEKRIRIAEHAKRAHKIYHRSYFLTLTDKVDLSGENLFQQWINFKNNVSDFLKYFCRNWDCAYEVVFESTYFGACHAHIVIHVHSFEKDDILIKKGDEIKVVNSEMRRWIVSHWKLGMSDLQRSGKRSPIKYLLKYITKTSYDQMALLSKKDARIGKEQRKSMLTLLMPILVGMRQFQLSQLPEEEKEESEQEQTSNQSISANLEKAGEARQYAVGGLDMLSFNLPCPKYSTLRAVATKKYEEFSKSKVKDFDKLKQEIKEQLYEMGIPMGCGGCVITHIQNELKTHKDNWFHKKPLEVTPEYDAFRKKMSNDLAEYYFEEKEREKYYGSTVPKGCEEIWELSQLYANKKPESFEQVPEGKDYFTYTDEEVEKRTYLLSKFDERVLPFILKTKHLHYTFYKQALTPPLKITFTKTVLIWDEEARTYVDMSKGTGKRKIHKYLLNPDAARFGENHFIEKMLSPLESETQPYFDSDKIDLLNYSSYVEKEEKKLTLPF